MSIGTSLHSRWALCPEDPWGLLIENFFPTTAEEGTILTLSLSDIVGIGASLSKGIRFILLDDVGIDDNIAHIWNAHNYLADNVGIDDGLVKSIIKVNSDTVGIDDTILKAVAIIVADDIGVNDTLANHLYKILSDALSVDDSLVKTIIKALDDDVGIIDDTIIKKVWFKALADSIGIVDSSSIGDLIHSSGNWIGHRYFNLLNDSRFIESGHIEDSWTKATQSSGGWTQTSKPSSSWAKSSLTSDGWTKKIIGV